ncbi:MAG: metallophosphoesterase family protein [Myxococcota bacterium]
MTRYRRELVRRQLVRRQPSRRRFLQWSGASAGLLTFTQIPILGCGSEPGGEDDGGTFHVALLADTHIIDSFYEGPEGNALDTETIFKTEERLVHARGAINSLPVAVDHTFIAGDVAHNYPSEDWDFYFENETRFDRVAELLSGFSMPVHPVLGNHDYDIPSIARSFTHDLLRDKWGIEPYYAVDHRGWKFLVLNNFLGSTQDASSSDLDTAIGSFGEEQLNWIEAQLAERRPTIVLLHYPMIIIQAHEVADYDLHSLLRKYEDTVALVIAGHTHRWMDFQRMFGPQHYVISSTRYDEDAFWLLRLDEGANSLSIVNYDTATWGSSETAPTELDAG